MKATILLLLILFIVSCKAENDKLYVFDPKSIHENLVTLSMIADDIKYIPLDNSFPIGMIFNYNIINNSIYLSAKDIGILSFNEDGKMLRKFGTIGRGPGEYNFYVYFTIDDKNETIYVMDKGSIIKVYSKTGYYLRSFSLREYGEIIDAFEFYNSRLLASFSPQIGDSKYDWVVLDTFGNLIKKRNRTLPAFTSNWGLEGGAYKFDNKLTYWNSFRDTILSVLPDLGDKTSFIINSGEHRFPRVKFESFTEYRKYLRIEKVFETDQFLVIRYFYKKQTLALIEKNDNRSFITFLEPEKINPKSDFPFGIVNDLDGGLMFLPEKTMVEGGREYMVGLTNPYQIKNLVSRNEFKSSNPKYPEKKIALEKLANTLKETDNPVLMLVRLKK